MALKTIAQFKDRVGLTVYGLPTGNNARGGAVIRKFTVEKVAIKYVTLSMHVGINGEHRNSNQYKPDTGSTKEAVNSGFGLNSGYIFFESMEAIEDYKAAREEIKHISDFFRSFGERSLSSEDAKTIYEIISKYK